MKNSHYNSTERQIISIANKLKSGKIDAIKAQTLLMNAMNVEHAFTKDDMRKAFLAGRESVESVLEYERWGDMEPYASTKVVSSFKQFIHEQYGKFL